jgi:hypothetical protein
MFILEAWIKELPTFTKWGLKYKLKKEYNLELSDYALIMNKRKEHFSIYKDKNNIPVYIYIIISMIEHIKKNIRQDYYWLIEKNIESIFKEERTLSYTKEELKNILKSELDTTLLSFALLLNRNEQYFNKYKNSDIIPMEISIIIDLILFKKYLYLTKKELNLYICP